MEGPISFWGYKEQESNLILPEHDDDDDDDDDDDMNFMLGSSKLSTFFNFLTLFQYVLSKGLVVYFICSDDWNISKSYQWYLASYIIAKELHIATSFLYGFN